MEPKLCPNYQANVEGLIRYCDCCGAPLEPQKPFFSYFAYTTGASGDLPQYLNKIWGSLDKIDVSCYCSILSNIDFDFYCYPNEMLAEKKSGIRFYASKKQIVATVVVGYEDYISGTSDEKLSTLIQCVYRAIISAQERLLKKNMDISGLVTAVESSLKPVTARH